MSMRDAAAKPSKAWTSAFLTTGYMSGLEIAVRSSALLVDLGRLSSPMDTSGPHTGGYNHYMLASQISSIKCIARQGVPGG